MRSRCHSLLPVGKCATRHMQQSGGSRQKRVGGSKPSVIATWRREDGAGQGEKKTAACRRARAKAILAQQNRRIAPSTRCQRTGGNAICT